MGIQVRIALQKKFAKALTIFPCQMQIQTGGGAKLQTEAFP
jgi:hypothetical protein